MDLKQVGVMLELVNMSYPNQVKGFSEDFKLKQMQIWHKFLESEDADAVMAIVQEHICTSQYYPTIADIKGKLRAMNAPSTEDLWNELVTASKRSLGTEYPSQTNGLDRMMPRRTIQFEKLSEPLKRFVGNARGLEEFFYTQRDEPGKARGMFDKRITGILETCKNEELRKQIADTHEQLENTADNVKKLESIGNSLFSKVE